MNASPQPHLFGRNFNSFLLGHPVTIICPSHTSKVQMKNATILEEERITVFLERKVVMHLFPKALALRILECLESDG
ncbi:hypothetical protein H7992_24320 [Sporosarcina sp. resist]|uniref:Uncharacterized protein n=1 Tax=Sporosarcina psychrophila TaxID=1476 RepID=A0ABV2KI24_SPOPS|nr:hypothetical protein [Sporosarcina sp. resist]AMQ04480.1 hypothetical protein AZE41_00045 [Sporosarcina psychrophila]QNK88193.1 hypothetical protein H7992_24320 [Sporosarcina sp. resist]